MIKYFLQVKPELETHEEVNYEQGNQNTNDFFSCTSHGVEQSNKLEKANLSLLKTTHELKLNLGSSNSI